MSLYNMIFKSNKLAIMWLKMLDINPGGMGRFRDCYLTCVDADDEPLEKPLICVMTRNGGGNRDEYQYVMDTCEAEHPQYVMDRDDPFKPQQ